MRKEKIMVVKEGSERNEILIPALMVGAMVMAVAPDAFAVTAPVTGSFAFDVYDIAVNEILKGPVGFVCGVGAIAFGAFSAIRSQIFPAVAATLGGGALIKSDAIVASLGMLI